MKEVYRSFEGRLGVCQQEGYIIYDIEGYWQIEELSVWKSGNRSRYRIGKEHLRPCDFGDHNKITELEVDAELGVRDNTQYYYKDKWWTTQTIRKIQQVNQDPYWQKYAC